MKKNLWQAVKGELCDLAGFTSDLSEDYKQRLIDLGFYPGQSIRCIMSPKFGAPKLFQVDSAVYSLDDKIATCIETK